MKCSKPSPILNTQTMAMQKNGLTTTIPSPSTNCRSNTPSVASQTAVTPLGHDSLRRDRSGRPPDSATAFTGWLSCFLHAGCDATFSLICRTVALLKLKPVRGQPQAASNRYKRPDPKAITQLAIQTL